jgi:hypothetical protein
MGREDKIKYKGWITYGLFVVLTVLAMIAVFNYKVDSLGLFHQDKGLLYIAKSLFEGKMVAGPINYNEGEFQRIIIENSPSPIDMVVVGSSRGMGVRKRFLQTEKTFFNHSMTAATLEDLMAIIGLYLAKGRLPRTIILCLDPWMFKEKNNLTKWQSIVPYYKKILVEIYGKDIEINLNRRSKYQELINLEYTLANIKGVKKRKSKQLHITKTMEVDNFVREPDGSLHFPRGTRRERSEGTPPLAQLGGRGLEHYSKDFYAILNQRLFEDFVIYLGKQGSEVILYLPPLEPVAYERIKEKYYIVIEIENYLRHFASKQNLLLLGSYDPKKYNFLSSDFFDYLHGDEIVAKRIFEGHQL